MFYFYIIFFFFFQAEDGIRDTSVTGVQTCALPIFSTGQTQSFTAQVIDASGAPLQNATVALVVNGANLRQVTATTDSTGHATFQYTGTNAGSDTVQATANISGVGEYSNLVSMAWTVPNGGG